MNPGNKKDKHSLGAPSLPYAFSLIKHTGNGTIMKMGGGGELCSECFRTSKSSEKACEQVSLFDCGHVLLVGLMFC